MKAKELNLFLIKNFPELSEEYFDEVDWQEGNDTGSHVVYGDVFSPYIESILDNCDKEKMIKVLNFIESLLEKEDEYADEVIMFSVLERVISNDLFVKWSEQFSGDRTKEKVHQLLRHS